jgi:hypothetical protein
VSSFCKIHTSRNKFYEFKFRISKMIFNRRIKFFMFFFSRCCKCEYDVIHIKNIKISLLLNSYALWHRHKTIHAKLFTYFIRNKNLNEKKKFLDFNFIATKIVVYKSTIIRRKDVYAHSLLFSSISNTKNCLRDKSNERVFELF